jgi:hypothetical protein
VRPCFTTISGHRTPTHEFLYTSRLQLDEVLEAGAAKKRSEQNAGGGRGILIPAGGRWVRGGDRTRLVGGLMHVRVYLRVMSTGAAAAGLSDPTPAWRDPAASYLCCSL